MFLCRRQPIRRPHSRRSGDGGRGRGSGSAKLAEPGRPDGFAFSVGGEVTECVEPFQATTVVHCRKGKLPGLSLSFPKCFTGTEICIEHGNWTQYVMMSILAGQEIAHLDCSRNHVDAISKILSFLHWVMEIGMLPSSLSVGTDIYLQALDFADTLERFEVVTVPLLPISLCYTFCRGHVATQIGFYLCVDGHIDTWRQCPFSEGTTLAAWRSIVVPDYVIGDACRGACYVASLPFHCKKPKC
jgi:hypothetical protein